MADRWFLSVEEAAASTCVEPTHWKEGRVGDTSEGHGHVLVMPIDSPCRQPEGEVPAMYGFASERGRGMAKLVEEAGELGQVMGKILAVNGSTVHWEGGPLNVRLLEEMADVAASIEFMLKHNPDLLDIEDFDERRNRKLALFEKWATHGDRPPA